MIKAEAMKFLAFHGMLKDWELWAVIFPGKRSRRACFLNLHPVHCTFVSVSFHYLTSYRAAFVFVLQNGEQCQSRTIPSSCFALWQTVKLSERGVLSKASYPGLSACISCHTAQSQKYFWVWLAKLHNSNETRSRSEVQMMSCYRLLLLAKFWRELYLEAIKCISENIKCPCNLLTWLLLFDHVLKWTFASKSFP